MVSILRLRGRYEQGLKSVVHSLVSQILCTTEWIAYDTERKPRCGWLGLACKTRKTPRHCALLSLDTAQSRGELRLVHGSATSYSYTSGRLEIFLDGRWGTICNDADFGLPETSVACQQLGWSGALTFGFSTSMG